MVRNATVAETQNGTTRSRPNSLYLTPHLSENKSRRTQTPYSTSLAVFIFVYALQPLLVELSRLLLIGVTEPSW